MIFLGGGIDDEIIDVVYLSIPELKSYVQSPDIASPSECLHGIYWFLFNKSEYCL